MIPTFFSTLALLTTGTSILAQDAVQWQESEGGNGHWYEVIQDPGTTWNQARERASAGNGHLATLTSESENLWVYSTLGLDDWGGLWHTPSGTGPALGAFWNAKSGWSWVTGEEWSYSNFDGNNGQPVAPDSWGLSYRGVEGQPLPNSTWQAVPIDGGGPGAIEHASYVVEYSADCNGDGLVDYGQILDGTLTDQNENGIPDCCDEGTCLEPIQWRVEDGGNGHWYQVVAIEGGFSHAEARAEARLRGGYLASLTTQAEDEWVYANLSAYDRWIGGIQNVNAPDYAEPAGGWAWSTGEAMDYTNWSGNGPDNNKNSGPEEEFTHYCCDGKWNDIYEVDQSGTISRKQMIVEYTVLPETPLGACCIEGLCISTTESDCTANAGTWGGADSSCTAIACEQCEGDLNGDGRVDGIDLAIVLAAWGNNCE
jgi:hypothetical protein